MKDFDAQDSPLQSHPNQTAVRTAHTVSGKAAGPDAQATRLHAALDAITRLPLSPVECREALLDCILSQHSLVAAAWYRVGKQRATSDVHRLKGPVFERGEIQKWLADVALKATTDQCDLIAESRSVKNLKAVCIPELIDPRKSPAGDESTTQPAFVLVLLGTTANGKDWTKELLAGQCVVRAWTNWQTSQLQQRSHQQLLTTSALLELQGTIATADDLKSACQTATNALKAHFDCDLVAIGLVPHLRETAKLVSISGVGDFDQHAAQAQKLEAAVNEGIIRKEITSYPAPDRASSYQNVAHKRGGESLGSESVVTVPLLNEQQQIIGAILFSGAGRKLLPQSIQAVLSSCSQPIGTAISTAIRVEGGPLRKFSRSVRRFFENNGSLAWGLLFLLCMGGLLTPMPYRIHCRCEVEPVLRRYCLAPYDGLLENTFVQPGDVVESGDLLARMDGREVNWELAGVTADSARAMKELDAHMAERNVSKAIMSELEAKALDTRAELLKHRREHLDIRSPLAGVVLGGSLDQRQNYPVSIGETLYEIAPLNPLRLEIAVPAEEIPHVEIGQRVEVRVDGETGIELAGEVMSIRPQSEVKQQQNVFVVEMQFENPAGRFRPGMEGSARITTASHPLAWNLCHRAWEKFATRMWW